MRAASSSSSGAGGFSCLATEAQPGAPGFSIAGQGLWWLLSYLQVQEDTDGANYMAGHRQGAAFNSTHVQD